MLRKLLCLTSLLFSPLAAEQVDNIIFNLPASEHWAMGEEVANSLGLAVIYLPEGDDNDDTFQIFSTQLFRIPFVNDNPDDFGKWMQIAFPFFEMRCNLIQSSEDSLTAELFGFDEGKLEVYTLLHKVRSQEGTVVLTYSCDGSIDLEKVQGQWIPIMLAIKPIANSL